MEFKVGDKVKIIAAHSASRHPIGYSDYITEVNIRMCRVGKGWGN